MVIPRSFEQLLKEHADVNIQNKEGVTALIVASQNGHTQVVEQLLKEHADINIQTKESVTALMKASEKGHTNSLNNYSKSMQMLTFKITKAGLS